jgi:hypothetical protein
MKISENIQKFLFSNPWTEYRTRIDLLGQSDSTPEVKKARQSMIDHPATKAIVEELREWPGVVLNSHKSAGQLYHKLSFLADLGYTYNDPGISEVVQKIMDHASAEGPFQLPMNIPVHFGGTGKDQYAWALCDAPVQTYSLIRLGLAEDAMVVKAKSYLVSLGSENGYHCIVSKELGKFRGPGKKTDPCPYATLIMLKMMNLYEEDRQSTHAKNAVNSLLNLWQDSQTQHPYMFYMGTDFRKLKAPFIWYDILHFADTLSHFPSARKDKRLKEIVKTIEKKADSNGLYTPESEWKAWKGWDFGQKKEPSAWMTFLVHRILKRMNEV